MFDVSGLTEVKMKKMRGWQGSYYVDNDNNCKAKTCSKCKDVLPSAEFSPSSNRYNLASACRACVNLSNNEKHSIEVDGKRLGSHISSKLNNKYKARSDKEVLEDRRRLRPLGLKQCIDCKKDLPLEEYNNSRNKSDGLDSVCRGCKKARSRVYRDTIPKKESRDYNKKYRASLVSRTDDQIEVDAKRSRPTGGKTCYKCRVHKDLSEFYVTRGYLDGRSRLCKTCESVRNRTIRTRPYVEYWYSENIPLACYICEGPWEHADHVIAEKLDGSDEPHNRLPICEPCNRSKWMHPLRNWLKENHPDKYDEVIHRVTVEYGMEIDPTPSDC